MPLDRRVRILTSVAWSGGGFQPALATDLPSQVGSTASWPGPAPRAQLRTLGWMSINNGEARSGGVLVWFTERGGAIPLCMRPRRTESGMGVRRDHRLMHDAGAHVYASGPQVLMSVSHDVLRIPPLLGSTQRMVSPPACQPRLRRA
jgi:hypothetical protein